MSALDLVISAVAIGIGAAIQGGVGFGMNLLAAPIVALVAPDLIPGPLLVAGVAFSLLLLRRERASLDVSGLKWAFAGRLPGTVVGTIVVASLPAGGVAVAVALAVIAAAILSAVRLDIRPTPATLVIAGVASGVSGTVSSIGGPPMALVYASQPGPVIRGTLSAIFIVGGSLSLLSLALAGEFGVEEAVASLVVLPPLVVGFAVSPPLARHLDAGRTRAAVLAVSVAGALAVLMRQAL